MSSCKHLIFLSDTQTTCQRQASDLSWHGASSLHISAILAAYNRQMVSILSPAAEEEPLVQLLDKLLQLYADVHQQTQNWLKQNPRFAVPNSSASSAINLAQFLALRQHELRELQDELSCLGLSSLGRGESGVFDNLRQVIKLLSYSLGKIPPDLETDVNHISGALGRTILKQNTRDLFGPAPPSRDVYIMVTMPDEAAEDYLLVKALLMNGMNCARINCAHGNRQTWLAMIEQVQRASVETGLDCRIAMDLAGQKIRTCAIEGDTSVYHLKPKRNIYGNTLEPGFIQIVRAHHIQNFGESEHFQIVIDDTIQAELNVKDRLYFVDLRGKRRHLEVIKRDDQDRVLTSCWDGAYISNKTRFQWKPYEELTPNNHQADIALIALQPKPAKIRLYKNDHLLLTGPDIPGRPASVDDTGNVITPAQIGLSHGSILAELKAGAAVWIDDGKIGAVVESLSDHGALLRITHARSKGTLLRPDKGVNFPDTELTLPSLTTKDLDDLDFVCQHANIVAYSFVQDGDAMLQLQNELNKRGTNTMPIIAKIETARAVKNLPEIILSTLGRRPIGIMIARGDLAIELGSVRMAEIQEEMLSLCEAAHVPVIWATQVLESMTKEGLSSRPEITDAAMSVRAEVVMLNKGPYIVEALTVLNEILKRMQAHQRKKSTRLRALHQWPLEQV